MHRETWMADQSQTSSQPTSPDTRKCTCLPGLADGPSPCDSPAGPTTDLFGQPLAPASRSVSRASSKAPTTNGTSGRRHYASSASVALSLRLASKLVELVDLNGSPEYSLTWSQSFTGSGLPVSQLAASARRTSDSGSGGLPTGWPTPTKGNADGSQMAKDASPTGRRPDGSKATVSLNAVEQLAAWPTPMVGDSRSARNSTAKRNKIPPTGIYAGDTLVDAVSKAAGWATPTTRDHKDGGATLENTPINALLGRQVSLAGWATPRATDGEKNERTPEGAMREAERKGANNDLATTAQMTGATTGSPAPTDDTAESPRQCLNPGFSLWLQLGPFAVAWLRCVLPATPSSQP